MKNYQHNSQLNQFLQKHLTPFNKKGHLLWPAMKLAKILGYNKYFQFKYVIKKAKIACINSNHVIEDHFQIISKQNKQQFPELSRNKLFLSSYACGLVIQNANPAKKVVASGQNILAQEFAKHIESMESQHHLSSEDESRLLLRHEIYHHNKELAKIARQAGVLDPADFSAFQNLGYRGLYGGLDQKEIHQLKQLHKSEKILDFMSSTELAANLFRATQTEEKLK